MPIRKANRATLAASSAAAALMVFAQPGPAIAQEATYNFDIPAQDISAALIAYGRASRQQLVFDGKSVANKKSAPLVGDYSAEEGLTRLLTGTGLRAEFAGAGAVRIVPDTQGPQGGSAAGAGAEVEALIVTAQKREEDIQDVPIAISAFTQEDLTRSQVAGGPDLMTQVPNMTFTKTNFSSYSIQLRGVGTQAISATTDPAVAVAFNNTPFVRNRFFEQEFYDLQRVEVLRGPQGTLYGRNATAGVVNLISQKPRFAYEAKLSGDLANYNSVRLEGMINLPLVEDKVALRLAGAWTKRNGYVTNEITGSPIDGRDLWSTRLSLRFDPTAAISANLIWEHFEEDDDRLRSGKQLCKKHVVTEIGGVLMPVEATPGENSSPIGTYNQGCVPASLYAEESFQTPNGFALPYYHPLAQLGLPTVRLLDPYASTVQSQDLRVIESIVDPQYRAKTDIVEFQLRFNVGGNLTLDAETAYSLDSLFSTQDYNRFNTSRGAFDQDRWDQGGDRRPGVLVDGIFCDPQIGCADRLVGIDLSTADSRHLSQELRLSSDYDGPFNFSLGANFLRYDTLDKYYVFINTLSLWAAKTQWASSQVQGRGPYIPGVTDNADCVEFILGDPGVPQTTNQCIYIDPNPIGQLNDLGHNYFLSKNPYRLISYAVFGETYYRVTDNIKVTAGLRYTVDKKHAPQIPSWLLADNSIGYPVAEIIDLEWREPTGRLAVDWKPDLSFTDETLIYGSYAHGYKAGGANPPPMVIVSPGQLTNVKGVVESVLHPKTFDAEYVDAFEIGIKNTLLDGALRLNANAFYYDYKNYQISQIIDRTAVNSNFDADVWGLELEIDWSPIENLRLGFKGGYENTRMADGSRAIDVMDRTAGNADWVVAKPFPALSSNCILPVWLVTFGDRINTLNTTNFVAGDIGYCAKAYILGVDPVTEQPYQADPPPPGNAPPGYWDGYPGFNPKGYPETNNGAGFYKDLSGNELPNAPDYTATFTIDYALPLQRDWLVNLHADLYYQSEAWTRIFNTEGYDKLKAYTNVNLAAIFTNEEAGWKVMAYIKNVFDRDSITGAFLNSDDSGLTTNVFLTEPRLYGLRITKEWTGVPLLGERATGRAERPVGEPYRYILQLGGGSNRVEANSEVIAPPWLDIYRPDNFPLSPQQHDFDRDDAKEIILAWAPSGRQGPRLSLGHRFGRTSNTAFGDEKKVEPDICLPFPFGCSSLPPNWGASTATDIEEYAVTEFRVGKEFGIGWRDSASILSAGLKYASLKSTTDLDQRSNADHCVCTDATGFDVLKYDRDWHDFADKITAHRSFEGAGPTLTWQASRELIGSSQTGRLGLEWEVGGGVLFGKQKARVLRSSEDTHTTGTFLESGFGFQEVTYTVDPPIVRSRAVQTPNLGASLGLSYSIDGISLGAGYRWERYFDAIDGGIEEHQSYDRTIDGPYFKIAIGFGG